MEFIPLTNMIQQLKAGATDSMGNNGVIFKNTSNQERKFSSASTYSSADGPKMIQAENPFLCGGNNTVTSTSTSLTNISFCASSADSVPFSTISVPSQIGTTTSAYTRNTGGNGWICIITVTASSEATIKHLVAVRKLAAWSYASGENAVLWALKLDGNGVELNSNNNYTASFTFSVTYD